MRLNAHRHVLPYITRMINQEPLNLHVMVKQGITWYNLETEMKVI